MLKRISFLTCIIVCISILFGCQNNSKSPTAFDVIRYPMLGDDTQSDFSAYFASGLDYPTQLIVAENKQDTSRKITVNNKEYEAVYTKSHIYEDGENLFLKRGNYDEYYAEDKIDLELFQDTGCLKKLYILRRERRTADKILTDFSEGGLKSTADTVLLNLYGPSINKYLNSYYRFEFAKLIEYANIEQNRYLVCYRAYVNGCPTDDVLYVHFSPDGVLMSVSAERYLQYLDVDEASLIPVEKLEKVIRDAVNKLDYTSISLRERENTVTCYYTMNANGELYYVMEWVGLKQNSAFTTVEKMAVKAS